MNGDKAKVTYHILDLWPLQGLRSINALFQLLTTDHLRDFTMPATSSRTPSLIPDKTGARKRKGTGRSLKRGKLRDFVRLPMELILQVSNGITLSRHVLSS